MEKLNKQLFSSLFKVGDIIDSGGFSGRKNSARLKIISIEDERVRYQSLLNRSSNSFHYFYLDIILDGFERIDKNSIQKTIQPVLLDAGQTKNVSTENYLYGFAKEVRLRINLQKAISEQALSTALEDNSTSEDGIADFMSLPSQSPRQGFMNSPIIRKAIEDHAVHLAKNHFTSLGYQIEIHGKPFDLLCILGQQRLYVEVKGTQGSGSEILLTKGEVKFNRDHSESMALFIVSEIIVSVEGQVSSGTTTVIEPWTIDEGSLFPYAYTYRV